MTKARLETSNNSVLAKAAIPPKTASSTDLFMRSARGPTTNLEKNAVMFRADMNKAARLNGIPKSSIKKRSRWSKIM